MSTTMIFLGVLLSATIPITTNIIHTDLNCAPSFSSARTENRKKLEELVNIYEYNLDDKSSVSSSKKKDDLVNFSENSYHFWEYIEGKWYQLSFRSNKRWGTDYRDIKIYRDSGRLLVKYVSYYIDGKVKEWETIELTDNNTYTLTDYKQYLIFTIKTYTYNPRRQYHFVVHKYKIPIDQDNSETMKAESMTWIESPNGNVLDVLYDGHFTLSTYWRVGRAARKVMRK